MSEEALEAEINDLKIKLHEKEETLRKLRQVNEKSNDRVSLKKLTNAEINKFSRQIIIPEIGVKGQLALKAASVLIVGAGGLGCPSALYLTGAGVGFLGKCKGQNSSYLKIAVTRLNSSIQITPYHLQLDSSNALDIVKLYDVVIDATDNVATRYLLNDACVMAKHPLVSGSALQLEDCTFRNVKLRDKNPSCAVCGNQPSISALIDYEQFCGSKANDKVNITICYTYYNIAITLLSSTLREGI
ncbi:Adenylyltransferase and sulfurtransferase MOCS3 [Blattella germanica]|nr:Adenylyltransferase and sulfurtransferase MOCS3 [Blattella germanica]